MGKIVFRLESYAFFRKLEDLDVRKRILAETNAPLMFLLLHLYAKNKVQNTIPSKKSEKGKENTKRKHTVRKKKHVLITAFDSQHIILNYQ